MSESHTSVNPTFVSRSAIQHQCYALKYNSLDVKFILGPYMLIQTRQILHSTMVDRVPSSRMFYIEVRNGC
jgi:hypothetical protein